MNATRESLFGTPTGTHTHPATHPLWLTFTDGDCVVCAAYAAIERQVQAEEAPVIARGVDRRAARRT